jgi:hypothetical protein
MDAMVQPAANFRTGEKGEIRTLLSGVTAMSQIILPHGFELVALVSWDDLPAVLRGARSTSLAPGVADVLAYASTSKRQAEARLTEEEVERWDGMS